MTAASSADSKVAIVRLFDEFVAAFARFDGERVAQSFIAPGVALRRDGSLVGFASIADVAAYYQTALDRYRTEGCTICRFWDCEIAFLNERVATATVSWDLTGAEACVIASWRQSYCLTLREDGWRIYGSAFVRDLSTERHP